MSTRIGQGWDVHRIVDGRPLILGGVTIPSDFGLQGHSDADVLSHAITDAILGAIAAGDIGMHFPDTDPRWKGCDSLSVPAACLRTCGAGGLSDRQCGFDRDSGAPEAEGFPAGDSRIAGEDDGARRRALCRSSSRRPKESARWAKGVPPRLRPSC